MTPELPRTQYFMAGHYNRIYYNTEHKGLCVARGRTRAASVKIAELLNQMLRHLLNNNQPCVVDKMIMEILNKED